MQVKFLLISLMILFGIISCKNESDEIVNGELKSELESYATSYMSDLKSVLLKNMKDGGPLQAVNVCSDTAALLTTSFSERMSVDVKRFSNKNRNSQNSPNKFEKEYLEEFESLKSQNKLSADSYLLKRVTSEGKDAARLVKPILVAVPCLNCHGADDQISSDVKSVINEKYPGDRAKGYKIGDLRGAISVTKIL